MERKHKALLLSVCAVVLAVASVFGTLAYFTDSEAVVNTFTVGKVEIKMDEADVKEDGTLESENRVHSNKYHLIPGHTYIKDPIIRVSADSEDCYLFVKVENGIKDIENTDTTKTIAAQMEEFGWAEVEGVDNVYILAKGDKNNPVSKSANVEIFKNFTIDGDTVDNKKIAAYKDAKVNVTAYAIQAAGFESATAAEIWNAAKFE